MKQADSQLLDRINRTLTNHSPAGMGVAKIEHVRECMKVAAAAIVSTCPEGRHRSVAITHLEDACMWAVKSIVLKGVDAY